MGDSTLEGLRSAMKFSMWTWAAYWPGGGLMLLAGGMTDPISIVVALLATAGLLLVLTTGALRVPPTERMTARQWLLERPIYLLVILVVCAAAGSFVQGAPNIGLSVFSALFAASIVLCIVRLKAHLDATRAGVFASGADQTFMLLGMVGVMAFIVFADSLSAGGIGTPGPIVAILNWVQLLYPPLLLVAARPFRERLEWPQLPKAAAKREPVPVPVPATVEA